MKKIILLISATIILSACNMQVKQNYKYVERVREQSVLGGSSIKEKEEKTISASSDSSLAQSGNDSIGKSNPP